jgi:hypothetical protein
MGFFAWAVGFFRAAGFFLIISCSILLVKHYRSDTLARMHQIKGPIDIVKWHRVGNEIVNIYLAIHIPVDNLGYIGTAPSTTKC